MQENQRINIQYSIGMDELPTEVTRVYKKALTQYRTVGLPDIPKNEILTSPVIKVIDEARQNLAKLDIMLGDVQSIVNAYVEYELSLVAKNASQEHEEAPLENDENTD